MHDDDQSTVRILHSVSHFIRGIMKWISKAYGLYCNDCNAGKDR